MNQQYKCTDARSLLPMCDTLCSSSVDEQKPLHQFTKMVQTGIGIFLQILIMMKNQATFGTNGQSIILESFTSLWS
jgi:hypothetical protein